MPSKLDSLKSVKEIPNRDILFCLARVPASSRVFVGTSGFKVQEVDTAAAKPEFKDLGAHSSYVTGLALAGNTLISGSYDGRLIWWDIEQHKQVREVEAHKKWIRDVVVSRDGKLAASVADDMVCRLWDVEAGKLVHELRGHEEMTPHHYPSMLYACAFSPDGKQLASADKVGHVVVWDTATGKSTTTLEAPVMYTWDPTQRRHSIGGIRSLAFSPDGKLLAVGGMGKVGNIDHLEGKIRVEVFDWQKGERTHEFNGDKFNGLVERLEFHPQSEWLLGAGGANDGFLAFFDLKEKKSIKQDKVAMHIHDTQLDEKAESLHIAGHGKLQIFEMKGS
jgi:WD40 repeat protein